MSTKLQINSLEALEKLIGGDSEVEMDIRNNIVQKFTEKHLKAVANIKYDQEYTKFLNELEKRVKEQFNIEFGLEEVQGYYGSPKILRMGSSAKESFRAAVQEHVKKFVYDATDDATDVAIHNARETIDSYLKSRVDYHIKNILNESVEKLIVEKVKEKLGKLDVLSL